MSTTLTTEQVAKILCVCPGTLRIWRMQGKGPIYVRPRGPRSHVLYLEEDVETYLREYRFTSTAEEAARVAEAGR